LDVVVLYVQNKLVQALDQLFVDSSGGTASEPLMVINALGASPRDDPLAILVVNSIFPVLLDECAARHTHLSARVLQITPGSITRPVEVPESASGIVAQAYAGVAAASTGAEHETVMHASQQPTALDVPTLARYLSETTCTRRTCTIRTTLLGKTHDGTSLLEWCEQHKGQEVTLPVITLFNGVTVLELAKYVAHIVANNTLWTGTKVLASAESVTTLDLLRMWSNAKNLGVRVEAAPNARVMDARLDATLRVKTSLADQLAELADF
jgi:hypothetical protein